MRLVFQSLELENYRYYYGTQRIEFPTAKNKNVLVIKGDNGAGKSNILNALTWCLYGEEVHTDKNSKGLPLMNTEYVAELAQTNREGVASVTLMMEVDGKLWEVERHIRGTGFAREDLEGLASYEFRQGFAGLKVTYFEGNEQKIEAGDSAQRLLNELLPAALRSFFFIDGEQLREFFKVDATYKMQQSIEQLSQLDLLEMVGKSLEICRKELRVKIQENNPATASIQKEIGEKEETQRTVQGRIREIEELIREYEEELSIINQYLNDNQTGTVSTLSKEIINLEGQNKRNHEKLNDIIKRKSKYLVESAPVILLRDVVDEANDMIESLIEKGDLPPKIRQSFIEELLEKGVCVCGTKLTDVERDILKDYADKIQLSELTNIAFEGRAEFGKLKDDFDTFIDKVDLFNEDIEELEGIILHIERDIEQKKADIAEYDVDEINRKIKRRDELTRTIGAQDNTLLLMKRKEKTLTDDLSKLARLEAIENNKHAVHDKYTKQVNLVNETLTVLKTIEERVKDTIRTSLEKHTKDHFMEFLREEGVFRDVTIDEKYRVSVINNQGFDALANLSAGQYLILGYAFVVALRTITGYNAPVIVDTPLGKLDTIHRDKVTKLLPDLLGDAQLVFLVTSSEYTTSVKENFAPHMEANAYYEILKDEDKTSARLVQNGF